MKLETGQVVSVTVKATPGYGLFCEYDRDTELLVLLPEISWTNFRCTCKQVADIGDLITVKVIRIATETGQIVGSIRECVANPWANKTFEIGSTHTAKIIRRIETTEASNDNEEFLLELTPGVLVMLYSSGTDLSRGDECTVVISETNPENRTVLVALIDAA